MIPHRKRGRLWSALILTLFLALLVSPSVQALTLAGKKISPITYLPGDTIVNHYTLGGTDQPVEIKVDKGPFTNISVTEVIDNKFDLVIHFPQGEYVSRGSHIISLTASEVGSPGAGVSAQVAVSKTFEIIVYSSEKEIQVNLAAANVNEGSKVTFQLTVTSIGYPAIGQVQGVISVYNHSRTLLGQVVTEARALPGLGSTTFSQQFDSALFPTGEYWAKALVTYDGQQKKANTTFLIGSMDVLLQNYTTELSPGFTEFFIRLKNNWGNVLRNVYAKVMVNGTELLQTPSLDLNPWQEGELKGIMKVDLPPGTYPALLTIYFEGEFKEFPITLRVVAPVQEELLLAQPVEKEVQQAKSLLLFPMIVAIMLLLSVLLLLWRRKRQGQTGRDKEW